MSADGVCLLRCGRQEQRSLSEAECGGLTSSACC